MFKKVTTVKKLSFISAARQTATKVSDGKQGTPCKLKVNTGQAFLLHRFHICSSKMLQKNIKNVTVSV